MQVMINKNEAPQLAVQYVEGLSDPSGEEMELGAITLSTLAINPNWLLPSDLLNNADFVAVFNHHITLTPWTAFTLPPLQKLHKGLTVHLTFPTTDRLTQPLEKAASCVSFLPFFTGIPNIELPCQYIVLNQNLLQVEDHMGCKTTLRNPATFRGKESSYKGGHNTNTSRRTRIHYSKDLSFDKPLLQKEQID